MQSIAQFLLGLIFTTLRLRAWKS